MHHTPHAPPTDRPSPHLPAGWVPAATRHAHALRQQAIAEVMDTVAGQVRAALGPAWRQLARLRRPAAMVKEQPCHS
jgi:hypothetical protein